jgi:hypothetical protein
MFSSVSETSWEFFGDHILVSRPEMKKSGSSGGDAIGDKGNETGLKLDIRAVIILIHRININCYNYFSISNL